MEHIMGMGIVLIEKGSKKYHVAVPDAELITLQAITKFATPPIVKQIKKQITANTGRNMSEASIYTFVKRLAKRNLVNLKEVHIEVFGTKCRRVLVQKNFENMEILPIFKRAP